MKERGFHIDKSSVSYWRGIRLIAKVSDFLDAQGKPLHRSAAAAAEPGDEVEVFA